MSSPLKLSGSDSADASPRPPRILVVCKGNVCRSPLAEVVFEALGSGRVEVRSRGTRSWHDGGPANADAVKVAADRGYDLTRHIAHEVSDADIAWADQVLAVDRETIDALLGRFGASCRMKARLYRSDGEDIPDPYKQTADVFHRVLTILEKGAAEYLAGVPSN